jgi:hypothetical protein
LRGLREFIGIHHAGQGDQAEHQCDNRNENILTTHDLLLSSRTALHPLMEYEYFKLVLQSDKDANGELIVQVFEQCGGI